MLEDPYTVAIATALAANAATATAGTAWKSVVRLVRKRLDSDGEVDVLDVAQAGPDDEEAVSRLAVAIAKAADADSGFAAELERLWPVAEQELNAGKGSTLNSISGTIHGPVIQARTVHNPDMRTRYVTPKSAAE